MFFPFSLSLMHTYIHRYIPFSIDTFCCRLTNIIFQFVHVLRTPILDRTFEWSISTIYSSIPLKNTRIKTEIVEIFKQNIDFQINRMIDFSGSPGVN